MSQSAPLSKLLPRYNAVVESFQQRMQQDNTNHLDNMLSLYTHALQGGFTGQSLSYLEKKLASRDDYNNYRMNKDASEWMEVDKKLHSYLGRNMSVLTGGNPQDRVPSTKEPQLVQSLKLLSAFIKILAEKMMTSRHAALLELLEAIDVVLADPATSESSKEYLRVLHRQAQEEYENKLDRDANDVMVVEEYTVKTLAPNTSRTILRTGLARRLPEATAENRMIEAPAPASAPSFEDLIRRVAEAEPEEKAPKEKLEGGGGCSAALRGGGDDNVRFRSSAAQHLYNIISQ